MQCALQCLVMSWLSWVLFRIKAMRFEENLDNLHDNTLSTAEL